MKNTSFTSLIYRIIGKPELWHNDYIDVMHKIIDETVSFDDPDNFSELQVGDQILTRIQQNNETLKAFSSLLDNSRFKLIILDKKLRPIYNNKNADKLFEHISRKNNQTIDPTLSYLIRKSPYFNTNVNQHNLLSLDYFDSSGDQVYLRSISSHFDNNTEPERFYVLMVVDHSNEQNVFNAELIKKYQLTVKEQDVLRGLIHGKSIKEIATQNFISENTVKTHLKAIFRKTDTNSQAAVVRLILTHESQIIDSYFQTSAITLPEDLTSSNDKMVTLKSGNTICYAEYGPSDGRPLIVFHSGYSCRLTIALDYKAICERTNRRVIIPDRPGFGKTPFIEKHPENWNKRLTEFIDLLGIESYDIIGNVLGSQLAVNFAAYGDTRLKKMILTSPVIINHKKHGQYLTGILSPSVRLVRASKRFARDIYRLWIKSITVNIDVHYLSMLETSLSKHELTEFRKDDTLTMLVDSFKESANNSVQGISNEMVFCMSPLKLDFSKITIPVDIWYGSEDQRISIDGVKIITADFPNHRLFERDGYSEHIYISLLEEIIA